MKSKSTLRSFLALASSSLLAIYSANATTLYWDGTTASANADGGAGTWINGSTLNWDTLPFAGTDSVWTNGAHTAVFGGAAAVVATPVTIGTGGVTVGGLTFNANSYVINAGTNGLSFSSGTNVIQAYIGNNGDTGATITGLVGGTGSNIVLNSGADQRLFSLTLNGTSAGGWDGTTTLNAGTRMSLAVSNQALLNTSGITLNGGNILLTNTATGSENTLDRIKDTAAIASYGNGSISIANTATASRAYNETIGSITHNNGQLSLGFTTVQNQTSNTQTLIVGGLTNSGTTSTIAINGGGSGAGPLTGNSFIWVNGITTSTATNEIIGPWMTAGSVLAAQSDWAVYQSDGVSGRVVSRGIAGSAETTWTSSSATGNYTAANANPLTSTVNNRLTADRFVNTLRATFAESAAATHTMTAATDTITFAGHALTDGDVVTFRAAGGLTDTRPYYVINSVAGTSFQLSLTPDGSLLDLTSDTEGFIATGLNLDGNTLGMNGYITGTTGSAAIGGGSASTITLPTTTSGNLYLHGANNIWIDPSIKDNGAGVLTLVKSGTFTLSLSGANTYSGGTVINNGTINFASASSWVSGQNITFGGAGRIDASVGALTGGILDIDQGAVGYITGSSAITFTSTTGAGKLVYAGGGVGAGVLNMGNASAFTGDLQVSNALGTNPYPAITFSSIGNTSGSSIQYGGGQGDGGQRAIIAYNGSAALTLSNRQIQLLPRSLGNNAPRRDVLMNNSTDPNHKLVIEKNLLNTADRTGVEFQLDGSNTGNNEFSGDIGDSTYSAVTNPTLNTLSVFKNGVGKWILSGDNTFTGRLLISNGTLSAGTFNNSSTAGPLGMGSVIQLGGAEATPLSGGSGLAAAVLLGSSNSGTLEYTGGAASTSRTFQIGSTTTHTGGGTIANNGSGALTFTAANLNDTIAGVSVARTFTLAGSNAGNNEVQGIIRDNVASIGKINLAKDGDGKWILSGVNSYTGTTAVNDGTLLINGNQSTATGAVSVASGAALGGTGTVGGSATFANTSIFAWNLSVTTPASTGSATVADTFAVTGTLVDGGAVGSSVFKILLAGSQTFADAFWTADHSWASVLTSGNSLALETLFTSFSYENAGGTITAPSAGSFALSGSTLNYTFAAVPEPTSALAGLLLTAGLLRRRRK